MSVDPTTGEVNWLPGQAGTYRVTIAATDGTTSLQQSYWLKVAVAEKAAEIVVTPGEGGTLFSPEMRIQARVAKGVVTAPVTLQLWRLSGGQPDLWPDVLRLGTAFRLQLDGVGDHQIARPIGEDDGGGVAPFTGEDLGRRRHGGVDSPPAK